MSPITRVECTLTECAYYTTRPGEKSAAYCKHNDKSHHMHEDVCPLYRMDWAKSQDKAAALRERFIKNKKKK